MNIIHLALKNDDEIKEYLSQNEDEDIEDLEISDDKKRERILITEKEKEENEKEEEDEEKKKLIKEEYRNFISKLFGPIEAGSIRGSIFNMIILSLGSGLLSLPKYIQKTSLLMSIFLIIGIGILVWWSMLLISKVCEKNNNYVYSRLIRNLYGPFLSNFYDCLVILYSIGVLILNQVIILKLIGEAIFNLYYFKQYNSLEEFNNDINFWGNWKFKYLLPFTIGFLIIYPLCLIKDVSKLRIVSLFGIITLFSLIILLVIQTKSYINYYKKNIYNPNDENTHYNICKINKGFDSDLYFFQFCSSLFFAYCSTIGAVPIFNTLKNNVRRRMYKVIRRSIITNIFIFITVVISGYFTWPINTPDLIIQRKKIINGPDYLMSIGRLALAFTIIMKLPSNYASLRITIFDKIWNNTEISNRKNIIVTFITILFCYTISVLYIKISDYIKILGGVCSTLVGFLFPAMLITRTNNRERYHWKNIATIFIFLLLTLIGFVASGKTIYDIFIGKH